MRLTLSCMYFQFHLSYLYIFKLIYTKFSLNLLRRTDNCKLNHTVLNDAQVSYSLLYASNCNSNSQLHQFQHLVYFKTQLCTRM